MQISFQQAWLPTPSTVPDHTKTAADVIPLILVLVRACILTRGLIFACGSICLEWLRSNYITRNLMGMSYNHWLRSILWTRWLQLPHYRASSVYILACTALCRPLCWFYSFHSTLFTDRHESFSGLLSTSRYCTLGQGERGIQSLWQFVWVRWQFPLLYLCWYRIILF